MRRRVWLLSVALNLLLITAGVWRGWFHRASRTAPSTPPAVVSMESTSMVPRDGSTNSAGTGDVAPPAFQWSQLDRSTWYAYRDALRGIGCPPPTVREIIEPLIRRDYRQRWRALIAPHVAQFWALVCPPSEARIKHLGDALDAISQEQDRLIEALFVGYPPRSDDGFGGVQVVTEAESLFSFLPPETQDRAIDVWLEFRTREQELRLGTSGAGTELAESLRSLQDSFQTELASFLSPEEMREFQLRRSSDIGKLRNLEGVELSAEQLKAIAEIRGRNADAVTGALATNPPSPAERVVSQRQALEQLLGPEKAAELSRAENDEFQKLALMADRVGVPAAQAAAFWEEREAAARRALEIAAAPGLTRAERQTQLEGIRGEILAKAAERLGGERGRSTWERSEHIWLERIFHLMDEDPLADPPP